MSSASRDKAQLRASLLRTRRTMTAEEREQAGHALVRRVRDLPSLASAATVAGYVSVGAEPQTRDLLEELRALGKRVLLPVLLPDNDLDWAEYGGASALEPAGRGLVEPTGERLGVDAVAQAQIVLLPGLAVDSRGVRLGRGGGSYDRVLSRLRSAGAHPALVVVLYAHEVVGSVPREPHDHLVDAAITPERVWQFNG